MLVSRLFDTIRSLKLPAASAWLLASMLYDEKHQANDEDNHMTKQMIEALRSRGYVDYVTMDSEKGRIIQLTEKGLQLRVRVVGLRAVS